MISLKQLISGPCMVLFIMLNTLTGSGQGISVSPSRMFFNGTPGQTVTQQVTFVNHTNKEINFIPSLKDWSRDSLGVKKYYPAANFAQSNANWISLSESIVKLAPKETKIVNVTMAVPEKPAEVQLTNSMLFFTQINEQGKVNPQKGVGLNILIEIGIQIYHTPPGLAAGALEFLAFVDKGTANVGIKKVRTMAVKIKNTGKINKDAYVRFELTNKDSGQETKITPIVIAMLPGAEQWVKVDLPDNFKGPYLAVAILDAGRQYDLKIAEKEIEL